MDWRAARPPPESFGMRPGRATFPAQIVPKAPGLRRDRSPPSPPREHRIPRSVRGDCSERVAPVVGRAMRGRRRALRAITPLSRQSRSPGMPDPRARRILPSGRHPPAVSRRGRLEQARRVSPPVCGWLPIACFASVQVSAQDRPAAGAVTRRLADPALSRLPPEVRPKGTHRPVGPMRRPRSPVPTHRRNGARSRIYGGRGLRAPRVPHAAADHHPPRGAPRGQAKSRAEGIRLGLARCRHMREAGTARIGRGRGTAMSVVRMHGTV